MYKAANRKAKVKKQDIAGQDQFGAAHVALRQAPQGAPQVQQANGPSRSAADLEKYFDALASATTTKKVVLEELVKDNSALTTTNDYLLDSVSILITSNDQLSRRVGNIQNRNKRNHKESPVLRPKTM